MPYFTEDQIRQARSIDLLTYLQTYEPTELIRINGNTWCTREHDSLKISSNGKWMWWSRGFGGASALDYLIKVKDMTFTQATNVDAGHGLLKVGSNLVPFENKFPKNTKLYELMTSKFGEGYFAGNSGDAGGRPGEPAGGGEEREILNKIREVSMNNEDFSDMVRRYMDGMSG